MPSGECSCNNMRSHGTPIRLAKTQKTHSTKGYGKAVGQRGHILIAGGNAEWYWPLRKTDWQFLTKLNIFFLYNPAVTLLSIYPKKLKI